MRWGRGRGLQQEGVQEPVHGTPAERACPGAAGERPVQPGMAVRDVMGWGRHGPHWPGPAQPTKNRTSWQYLMMRKGRERGEAEGGGGCGGEQNQHDRLEPAQTTQVRTLDTTL